MYDVHTSGITAPLRKLCTTQGAERHIHPQKANGRCKPLFFHVVLLAMLIVIGIGLLIPVNSMATGTVLSGKNILVLHSYHQTYVWTDQEMEGIMRVFREIDPNYMPYVEYLDWKRFPDQTKIETLKETLRKKYSDTRIDAVIVTDNKALDFALVNRSVLFPDAAVSFCGINDFNEKIIAGHERVSGVVEDVDPQGTLRLIRALLPETRELVLLIDDTESSRGVLAVIEKVLAAEGGGISLKVVTSPSPAELISVVKGLKPGSVIIQGPYLRDREGHSFNFENVLERILPHAQVPIFSLWEFLAGKGITGGSLLSGTLQGENAARIALRLMVGEAKVPVMDRSPSRTLLDYRQLERFGLQERAIPAGVEVINRPPSFVNTYLRVIIASISIIVFLVIIIAALIITIKRKQQAQKSLRESERKLFNILESVDAYIYIKDTNYHYQFANRSVRKLFGAELGQIIGSDDNKFFDEQTAANIYENDRKVIEEGETIRREEINTVAATGETFVYWSVKLPLRLEDGSIYGLCGISTDITERKRAEEERLKLEQQLLHAQKLESLGVLAGGIAHDFNNILLAIIGNADLALRRINKESPAVENLTRIEQSAARAADLAKQMLAYSGKGRFVLETIDLNRLLEEMLHMLEVSISKKAVLRLNLTRPLPTIEVDATQMHQIVMNLVINASEAIGDRSGVIAITTGCIDCDRDYLKDVWLDENISAGLYVYLEVADTGCGMDRETLQKIFDPFFTTKFTGRGLGMAAVMGIVRGHKGAIKVYSEPGRGSSFKVMLPASDRPAELFNQPSLEEEWQGSGVVLLVDDEETVRAIGREMLKELGYEVITANDGREALQIFSERDDIVFVILDLTMPHLDGEQCFRELRRIKPQIRVIMSSGYNEQEVTQKFAGKGLAGFIQKPYKLSALRDVIRGLN